MERPDLKEKIGLLPPGPGVYRFLDAKGNVIYVGKAKNLKSRVSSYFQEGRGLDRRLMVMRGMIEDISWTSTSSEAEALIFEASLIKDHSPVFNIEMKDDKSYPFLKLTADEQYPRLYITRRRRSDGALYYGPYVNVKLLRKAVSYMKKVFPLRSCRRMGGKACLQYHIGQCLAPCEDKVSEEDYAELVGELQHFLEGRKTGLMDILKERMNEYSRRREFEKALLVKERIKALSDMRRFHDGSRKVIHGELEELQQALGLPRRPVNIECFDISNLKGLQAVGSMVSFHEGRPNKAAYRRFRIKSVLSADDYAMIREVLTRRYERLLKEKKDLPDLVLIDGGKGHLRAAERVFADLGAQAPLASIAKEHEHIYIPGRKHAVRLAPGTRGLLLVQRVRDEAHRFAIAYHRRLRERDMLNTSLRNIKGIGPVKERLLLGKFGSLERIRQAGREELLAAGLDKRSAERLAGYFREDGRK